MTQAQPTRLRLSELSQQRPTAFDIRPGAATLQALAAELGLTGLRKMRFDGQIAAQGQTDWRLTGHLGATVVQPCVVTLAPVTTRIDVPVSRTYLAQYAEPDQPEAEMPEDDDAEPLPETVDLAAIAAEELALALPLYPRVEGADIGEAVFSAPGVTPMRDEDTRAFAGLAALRDRLKDTD